jgi:transposase
VGKPLKRLQNDTSRFAHQKRSHPDLNRLSKRIIKYQSELYVFIKAGIDPTNNAAEREIRPAVLMRKTSYGNRSSKGGKNQAILMSMIRTAHKQGKDFIQLATQSLIHH